MATVKMKKGEKLADIFDSPETIRQAQLEGYSLVKADNKSGKDENEGGSEGSEGNENPQNTNKQGKKTNRQ